jgi:hypothetical protein
MAGISKKEEAPETGPFCLVESLVVVVPAMVAVVIAVLIPILMVPVTFAEPPTSAVAIVARMDVVRPVVGTPFPAAGNPYVAALGDIPVAVNPQKVRTWDGWGNLIT